MVSGGIGNVGSAWIDAWKNAVAPLEGGRIEEKPASRHAPLLAYQRRVSLLPDLQNGLPGAASTRASRASGTSLLLPRLKAL